MNLGPFLITPFLVDHFAYDAYALLIEADGKRLLYSGDLRMHQQKAQLMDKLMAFGPKDVDCAPTRRNHVGARRFRCDFAARE